MTETVTPGAYGELIEPTTLKIQRTLPGPIERVWRYLTENELRRQWLAAGDMPMKVGASFELVWRNDELTDPPGERPATIDVEQHMQSRITELEPPYHIAFTWQDSGEVSFDLEPKGNDVLLTVIHRRLPDRPTLLGVAAGWHTHLDTLVSRLTGTTTAPFWDVWRQLKEGYDRRVPA